MAKKNNFIGILMGILIFFSGQTIWAASQPQPSGKIVNGFRVLQVTDAGGPFEWVVLRGDYIKFDIGTALKDPVLAIPSLSIEKKLSPNLDQALYFKMKKEGIFDFFIGSLPGTLKVVEYNQVHYEAVSAPKAKGVIDSFNPTVLDVRTKGEYALGHLENSVLIPVQQLQSRLDELAGQKDDPILIYCASGNRSTVASKILIDKGFTRIFNLRYGIADWARHKYPIVK